MAQTLHGGMPTSAGKQGVEPEIRQLDSMPSADTRVPLGTLAVVVEKREVTVLVKVAGDWRNVITGRLLHGKDKKD
jgi:hypothetical protein